MNITVGEIIGNFILIAGSFLLLVFLIKKFAWGNIIGILDQRAQKISDDIDGAEAARQEAEDLAQKREEALAGSREEAATIKETAEKNKAGILANAAEEAGRLKAKANQEIAQNKAEAMSSIKGEVADLTVTLASKILSQELDKEAQSELIDRYIKQLGDA